MTLVLLNGENAPQLVTRVPQGDARREHRLRDLIYDNPTMMPVHELDPSYGRLFTVARELNIPGVGFVDVVLADEHGRLVVVECKLWRNPQARREVVGQILDYAREFSRYAYEDLQRQISVATKQQGNVLYALAQRAGSTLGEADFVDRVSRDLSAGRFLLLIVGDGITEGTRRIGEYLSNQPGLAFTFGLIEMAEYRYADAGGVIHEIVQPRILARTAVIERHVIRSEVPNTVIDLLPPAADAQARASSSGHSEAGAAWRGFVERFIAEARFDDPAQPSPRSGGSGWIKVPLPGSLYINLYRSATEGGIGAQVRFPDADAQEAWAALHAERKYIDREFVDQLLDPPEWIDGDVPLIRLTQRSPSPWNDAAEAEQRAWFGQVANQLVNSLRPRLQRLEREIAA